MELAGVPWIDLAILALLLLSALISFWRGFAREALALLAWVVAIAAAVWWHGWAAGLFPPAWDEVQLSLGETAFTVTQVRQMLGFAVILFAVLIAVSLVNRLIVKHLFADAFHLMDRIIGIAFGLVRGALLVLGFVLLAGLTRLPFTESWAQSRLVPWFQAGAEAVIQGLPPAYGAYFSYPPNRPLPFGLGDKLNAPRSENGSV